MLTTGGAGPGGSGAASAYQSERTINVNGQNGDGVGGGAVFLFVRGSVRIGSTGKITANGGNGANGVLADRGDQTATGGGGAAGGGIVAIIHTGDYNNSGSITVNGGTGGIGGSSSYFAAENGEDGGIGVILISKLSDLLAA